MSSEAFINRFSWSKSRDSVFQECLRRYFFNYYGFWDGWDERAEARTREIYQLKQLKTRQMWAGEVVHDCIERSLRNIRSGIEPLPVKEIIGLTLESMRENWKRSQQGAYRQRPKSLGLFEHEYELDVPDDRWKQNADHVVNCLQAFYASPIYEQIRQWPVDRWLDLEDFSSFELDGTRIFVVLDFAARDDEGRIRIFDWKTGKQRGDDLSVQLACYALYATQKWNVEPESIQVTEYFLSADSPSDYTVTSENVERVKAYMRGSIRDMKELLADESTNLLLEESCPLTDDLERCRFCNFKRLCGR